MTLAKIMILIMYVSDLYHNITIVTDVVLYSIRVIHSMGNM